MSAAVTAALVAAGGAAGSLVRYAAGKLAAKRTGVARHGTLLVNLAGCFLLGLLAGLDGAQSHQPVYLLAGTGFLGGLTTYSTWMSQLAALVRQRQYRAAAAYGAATLAGGLMTAAAGFAAVRVFAG